MRVRPHVARRGLLPGVLLVALACTDSTPFVPDTAADRLGVWIPDSSATILHTSLSQLANPTLAIVSYPAPWLELWNQTWGGAQAAPSLPQIDFVLGSVVVVGLGRRAGPEYSVSVDSIVLHTTGSVLFATESQAGEHCPVSSGSSSAVHMVRAPGHPPVVNWRVGTVRRDCTP